MTRNLEIYFGDQFLVLLKVWRFNLEIHTSHQVTDNDDLERFQVSVRNCPMLQPSVDDALVCLEPNLQSHG